MTITIRAGETADDVRAAIAPIFHYFGVAPPEESVANFATLMTPARVLLAMDDDAAVGGCGSFPLDLTVPGGHVAACGLSMVGVMPTHRRRGILRALIEQLIADCRARKEPVAYLWASEERIYGRWGFGLTALSGDISVPRDHAALLGADDGGATFRRVPVGAAHEPAAAIFAKVASTAPGAFARSADWWQLKTLTDPAWRRRGGGEMQCVVADIDGVPAAYALYRMNFDTDRGVPTGRVVVAEAVGTTPHATLAIWRFLFDMDWNASIVADYVPLDHPLVLSVAEPRRLGLRLRDGAWLRIVDIVPALRARAYGPGEIVIEITDPQCPWNEGRWQVSQGNVARTEKPADLHCAIDALACVYLGGFTWRHLVASGRAVALSRDAVMRADRVFESFGAPWCPEIF